MQPTKVKSTTTDCARCCNKLETGDVYATEEITNTNHRFYHWNCIKKDPHTRKIVRRATSPYVEYNMRVAGKKHIKV